MPWQEKSIFLYYERKNTKIATNAKFHNIDKSASYLGIYDQIKNGCQIYDQRPRKHTDTLGIKFNEMKKNFFRSGTALVQECP